MESRFHSACIENECSEEKVRKILICHSCVQLFVSECPGLQLCWPLGAETAGLCPGVGTACAWPGQGSALQSSMEHKLCDRRSHLTRGEVYSSALRYGGTGKEQVLCGALPSGVQEDVTHPCASGLFLSLPPSNLVQLRSHPSHRPPFPGAHTAQRLAAVATSAETPRGDAAYGREKELLFYLCLF